ncbi:MAG TPA: formyltransferase [Steroidobacteraceae bacterium]|nr:formyltransferase [Steroidobacteraceae bacterium]
MSVRAVVFAYHDVGDRCLRVLLSQGIDVPLVVTHVPDPAEPQWFASVERTAREYEIPVLTPEDPEQASLERVLTEIRPDFLFSFYYRRMLSPRLLQLPRRGALNMHGSLLPRYRGRAPINWAILRGEQETGATLHYMVERADAGDIVDQLAVPILQDDDALIVTRKVTAAAEIVLARSLPALAAGLAPRRPQRLQDGEYFGRRTPEDGRIDWRQPARAIHNLVRAVAPPFPGAFSDVNGKRWWFHKTRVARSRAFAPGPPRLFGEDGRCFIACADGAVLELLAGRIDDAALDLRALADELMRQPIPLPLAPR